MRPNRTLKDNDVYLLDTDIVINYLDILPYDSAAETKYQDIPTAVRQQHPQDSHIAAIALAHNFTLITLNTRHFSKIPDLRITDWSI